MNNAVRQTMRRLIPAAAAYVPICFFAAIMAAISGRSSVLIWAAFALSFAWIVLTALTDCPSNARVFLTLPVRARSWSLVTWIQYVAMPFLLVTAASALYAAIVLISGDTHQSLSRLALLIFWSGMGLVVSNLAFYAPQRSAANGLTHLSGWYGGALLAVLALSMAGEYLAKHPYAWSTRLPMHQISVGTVGVACALGLLGSFLQRHTIFMAKAGLSTDWRSARRQRIVVPLFRPRGWVSMLILSNPLPGTLGRLAGYSILMCGIMVWAGNFDRSATYACLTMVTSFGMGLWSGEWAVMTRALAPLPLGKRRIVLVTTVSSLLASGVPIAVVTTMFLMHRFILAPSSTALGHYFDLLPYLLAVGLFLATLAMSRVLIPLQIIIAAVAVGFSTVLCMELNWEPDTISYAPVWCFGFLALSLSVWLMVRRIRRTLDDSAFYKKAHTQ